MKNYSIKFILAICSIILLSITYIKIKNATIKDSAGKILEYRVSLNTNILIKDFLSDSVILNQNFNYASTYKVQDQHSETTQLENKTIDNILNKTFENLLTRMSENMSAKW